MKAFRIFVVVLMALTFTAASAAPARRAATKKTTSGIQIQPKYQGDVNVGIFAANGGTSLTFGTTQGAMLCPYFYAGLSLNAEVSTNDFSYWWLAPLASLRGYYPIKPDVRVFLNPELGCAIGVSGTGNGGSCGFEYRLTAGMEYKEYQFGIGCGGAGSTAFFAKFGYVF